MSLGPLVSIAMSTYNAENTIKEAIFSIINQTYKNWELIITDDGSTDRTVSVIKEFKDNRIVLISDGKNLGLAKRLNQIVNLSHGKYIARMDADDISYPQRLTVQVKFLETNKNIDLISSKIIIFNDDGKALGSYGVHEAHKKIIKKPYSGFNMPHPTWMAKAEWLKNNPYSEISYRSEDQQLLLRTHNNSVFASINEPLLGYRQNDIAISKEIKTRISWLKDLFKYYLENKNIYLAIMVSSLQLFKGIYTIMAVKLNLEAKLLKHRFHPLTHQEIMDWEKIYNSIDRKTAGMK